tara:strand:- start:927 stop:1334 length:408 start_codon:yes stop_codon:yes gene_type:complete
MDLDRILVDLRIISHLKDQDKLGILNLPGKQQMVIYSGRSWLQGLYRYWDKATRNDVASYLNSLVQHVERQAELFSEPVTEKTRVSRGNLKDGIAAAIEGLEHLQKTYEYDSHIVATFALSTSKLTECTKQIKTE